MTDTPRPPDAALPPELLGLTEQLAEHVHDAWSALRESQGWTYGPRRDDAAKKHPCLVPYGELPESEKEADRRTALDTLRFILARGYRITPPAPEAP